MRNDHSSDSAVEPPDQIDVVLSGPFEPRVSFSAAITCALTRTLSLMVLQTLCGTGH
jgi:hypothetical protein